MSCPECQALTDPALSGRMQIIVLTKVHIYCHSNHRIIQKPCLFKPELRPWIVHRFNINYKVGELNQDVRKVLLTPFISVSFDHTP